MKTLNGDGQPAIGDATPGTGLVVAQNTALVSGDAFDKVVASSSFLPRVQLFGSNSGAVKEDKIGQGRYGLVRDKNSIEDLSQSFNCLPLDWRWKAMQVADGAVVSVYDFNSDAFTKLKDTADNEKDSGCMWGVEFLIWMPDQKEFATFYLSSATARREAKPMRARTQPECLPTTLTRELIKKPKYSWFGPKVNACSTPLSSYPSQEEVNEQVEKFRKSSIASKAKATGTEGDEGRER